MNKILALFIILQINLPAYCQHQIAPADELQIMGKITKAVTFTLTDLTSIPSQPIQDLNIVNHKGEDKGKATGLKGFLLKTLFDKITFVYDKPKELNEFYFIFVATDGYKVVFSWNEIFNTEVGNSLFVITEKDGKTMTTMEDRIVVVSASDLKIGRRYIKGLSKIIVNKVD